MKELGIQDYNYHSNTYTRKDRSYSVIDLIEASKSLPLFDLPIKGLDISVNPWGAPSIKYYAWHMQRVSDANLKYPIILDDEGYICDGWHRVVKAIIKGDETIKAVRLTVMPDCE